MVRLDLIPLVLATVIITGAATSHAVDGNIGHSIVVKTGHNTAETGTVAPATARSAESTAWHTDYREAVALAAWLKRPLLLNFTGSDWCYWCQLLKEEVFDTPEFIAWARKTVVLVEVDFPHAARQDARLRKQNADLAKRFSESVRGGYPTILFLDPAGSRTLGELGYQDGGPKPWIDAADKVLAQGK